MGFRDWLTGVIATQRGGPGRESLSERDARRATGTGCERSDNGGQTSIGDYIGGDRESFCDCAEAFVEIWDGLDYSADSLTRLDAILESQQSQEKHLTLDLQSGKKVTFAPIATGAACYFGEVLIRNDGARWANGGESWCIVVDGPADTMHINAFSIAHEFLGGTPRFDAARKAALKKTGQ
jgi:hypothetical protein